MFYNHAMVNFFRKKNIVKESNVAESPKVKRNPEPLTKAKVFFLIWNVLSITLYSCYTFFVIYNLSTKNFLSKVIIYLLIIYAAIFILLLLLSLGNRKKLNRRLKNYKSATNFLKYAIQIINFVLSIITAISALITTGTTDISAILYAVLSFIITLIFIFFEIVKIIIRKNIPIIKYNFLEIRDRTEDFDEETGTIKRHKKEKKLKKNEEEKVEETSSENNEPVQDDDNLN